MGEATPVVSYDPEWEYRRSFLLLRWLLIILAAYLALFSHLKDDAFETVCYFIGVFSLSNIGLMLLPRDRFNSKWIQAAIIGADILLVSVAFNFLRVPTTYLHMAFI